MNIYDFDNTIYDGDTNKDIILFGLKKCPLKVISSLNKARKLNKKYKKGLVEFERVKETMLSFIFEIDNTKKFIEDFTSSHIKNIKKWYLNQQNENDIIISASYDIWISSFAKKLGIKYVIATIVDDNGKIIGKNCKGEEKVNRLNKKYKNVNILTSYSDEKSDIPILSVAKKAFIVEGNKIIVFKKDYKFKK